MVKGISRRVLVVKTPDPKLFEEAIFLLREDAETRGVTDRELLRQARQAAGQEPEEERGRLGVLPRLLWALAGAAAVGAAWVLVSLF